jgi:membrane-bound ClpP family serine protease
MNASMRRAPLFVLLSALVWLVSSAAFGQERPSVLVAKVDGSIDRTLGSYLDRAVEDAEDADSTLVVQMVCGFFLYM